MPPGKIRKCGLQPAGKAQIELLSGLCSYRMFWFVNFSVNLTEIIIGGWVRRRHPQKRLGVQRQFHFLDFLSLVGPICVF